MLVTSMHAPDMNIAPVTNAELKARVTALEQDLASLERDYHLLLQTMCVSQPSSVSPGAEDPFERPRMAARPQALEEAHLHKGLRPAPRLEDDDWWIYDAEFAVTERIYGHERFGWKVSIKNGLPRRQTYDIEVQFLNNRGLVVGTARLDCQVIGACDAQTLRGDELISVPAAWAVTNVHVIARRHTDNSTSLADACTSPR